MNVYNAIYKFRDISDQFKDKCYDIINNIIISLNSYYDKKENYQFYKNEFSVRIDNNKVFF